jgi:spermidine synthase
MGLVTQNNEMWFYENLYSDVSLGFKVEKVLVPETDTGYQKLMILQTDRLGRVLVLDDVVQLTEEDEGIYHEWIVHWPMFSLSKPAKNVLIIGGGDGGVVREVLKHKSVETVTMVEIDKMVVDLCREHMSAVSQKIWDDPRFKLVIGDGAEAVRTMKNKCDVIIIDTTDPIGPAKSCFGTDFYQNVYDALVDGGIAIHQTGSLILQPTECPASWRQMERAFDDEEVIQFSNITYIGGPFSLTAGSKGKKVFRNAASNAKKAYKKAGFKCSWYSPQFPALVYPEFQRRLEQNRYGEEIFLDINLKNSVVPPMNEIARWSKETCDAINMIAFGTPMVTNTNFGEGDTLVQYIETSAINYRQYGSTGAANCFTCAELPVDKAVAYSLEFYGADSAVCWHIPRGSFSDVKQIHKNSLIYKAELSKNRLKSPEGASRPRMVECASVFAADFKLPIETGFSSLFELVIDVYDCNYSRIASTKAVAKWASEEFCKVSGLDPIGTADAPDFGHAKKKTAGPSVTQLLKQGSNISHYSVNWLMIVINIVSNKPYSIRAVIESAMKYFKGKRAVCWLIPRANKSKSVKQVAEQTLIFEVTDKDLTQQTL